MRRNFVFTKPEVGSSSKTTLEPAQSAMATESFRFIPPLNVCDAEVRFGSKPTARTIRSISAGTCFGSIPFIFKIK